MPTSAHVAESFAPTPNDWKPGLGLARMTDVIDRNEKVFWLLQVRLTPFNASKAGIKYDPLHWQGTPLIRVIWVNRGGHLAEYQEWLESGEEVQIPGAWEINVDEAIDLADAYSATGTDQTVAWLKEAQESSTLIDDVIRWEEQKSLMARNRSTFGPTGHLQRNGFPVGLRQEKFRASNRAWRNA